MTEEEYKTKKEELPQLSFATRHTIENFKSKTFPELETLKVEKKEGLAKYQEEFKLTSTGEQIDAKEPLYYSYSTISEKEQRVYASEAEAIKGGQLYDTDPLIYYRVKSPAESLTKLPLIDLKQYFKQAESAEQIKFQIRKATIDEETRKAIKSTNK